MRKSLYSVATAATILIAGCSDKEAAVPPAKSNAPAPAPSVAPTTATPAPVAPPPASATPVAAPVATPPPGTPTAPVAKSSGPGTFEVEKDYVPHLVNLNNAYQDFRSIEMRSPRDLNELVTAKRIDKLPPAPPGKQYKIDEPNLRIIIVNQ